MIKTKFFADKICHFNFENGRLVYDEGMKAFFSQNQIALCLGFFDGFHLAHKELINTLIRESKLRSYTPCVYTFDSLPNKRDSLFLQSCEARLNLLAKENLAKILLQKFNSDFASLSGEEFFELLLAGGVNLKLLVVGYDFVCGQNGKFTVDQLKNWALKYGIELLIMDELKLSGEPVHSKNIKKFLLAKDLRKLRYFLGRDISYEGPVVHGKNLGTKMGFSTVNMLWPEGVLPAPRGVYASQIKVGKIWYDAVTNIGYKPSVSDTEAGAYDVAVGNDELYIETHIFDFDQDLYDRHLEVRLLKFLREEKKFDNLELLKEAVDYDISVVKKYLKNTEEVRFKAQIGDLRVFSLPSERFNTAYFIFNMILPNELSKIAPRALMFNYMSLFNDYYKESIDFSRHLDSLYGADLNSDINFYKDVASYSLYGQALRKAPDGSIPIISVLEECVACITKVHRNKSNSDFSEKVLKKELENILARLSNMEIDEKALNHSRFLYYGKDNIMSYNSLGLPDFYQVFKDDGFNSVKVQNLLENTYHEFLSSSSLNLILTGSYSNDEWAEIFALLDKFPHNVKRFNHFSFLQSSGNAGDKQALSVSAGPGFDTIETPREFFSSVKELGLADDDSCQSYLHLYFAASQPPVFSSLASLLLFNLIFGGYFSSLLFMDVREKEKLCYYIHSNLINFYKNIRVSAIVHPGEELKAMDLIGQNLAKIARGDFADEDLHKAKQFIINDLLMEKDRIRSLLLAANVNLSIAMMEYKIYFEENLAAIGRKEIISQAQKFAEVFRYCCFAKTEFKESAVNDKK